MKCSPCFSSVRGGHRLFNHKMIILMFLIKKSSRGLEGNSPLLCQESNLSRLQLSHSLLGRRIQGQLGWWSSELGSEAIASR